LKILLTNDDGFDAEGLQRLYDVLSVKADCYVIAPDQGRSCCSHGVTTGDTLDVVARGHQQWAVSGTPADCVRVGLLWLGIKPDWVISGVNHGGNLGVDILYSGTVAGAREASLMGVRAIAVSQYMRRDVDRDWIVSAKRAQLVFENIFARETSATGVWNVNLPALPPETAASELSIRVCEPELQPLAFSFENQPEFSENQGESIGNGGTARVQTVLYKSSYQDRPRSLESDVAVCFGGVATLSWLTSDRVGLHVG
jgi:5'-nucleotidase